MKKLKFKQDGFGVVAWVVSLAILAILAGVAVPKFINWRGSQNDKGNNSDSSVNREETGPAVPSDEACRAKCRDQYGGSGSAGFDACIRACNAAIAVPSSQEEIEVGTGEIPFLSPGATDAISPSPALPEVSRTVTSTAPGVLKSFTVTGSNFSFSLPTITVKKGDTVKITFKNEGGVHDLVIDEFNVRTPQIGGGQSADIQFKADKTGEFEFYCSVGSHRTMGMKGKLVVQ